MALVLISHDLGVVAENTDRVCVMYAGRIVEDAPIDTAVRRAGASLYAGPARRAARARRAAPPRWPPIPGVVPDRANLPPGCSFAPRCAAADRRLRGSEPPASRASAAASRRLPAHVAVPA